MKCDHCEKEIDVYDPFNFAADGRGLNYDLCSLECVLAVVWKLRERQPKLSKSGLDKPGEV